ncbi:MAG: hypothetical protein WBA89_08095 [Microcoleus sp.]|uniref:hypothetical protein n=1 Tax=Microcoleus sp. TaxID=44472 RepID=UPI003C780CB9
MAGIQKSPNLIQTVADLEFPGGPIPIDSPFCIARSPAAALARAEFGKRGSLISFLVQTISTERNLEKTPHRRHALHRNLYCFESQSISI